MLEFLVGLMVTSFWVSLIGLSSVLFLMRLMILVRDKPNLKQCIFVLFTPCSVGYFLSYKEQTVSKTFYEIMVIIQFFLMLIGSAMIFYARYL